MRFKSKVFEVEAVQYKKDSGIEDGFAIYETDYPEEGHTFVETPNFKPDTMTKIQAAVKTPIWKVVSEGDWIVTFEDGTKKIWDDDSFSKRFVTIQE